jgi:hypothetical protein
VIQECLESVVVVGKGEGSEDGGRAGERVLAGYAEEALRGFLECGVARFGVVRYLCRECGESVFVAYSCKRRGVCPSCDGKRSAVTSGRAMEALLPRVAYRQWVLVIPKRLRYFVNRTPCLAGEVNRILRNVLADYYRRVCGGVATSAPAQIDVLQRFGSEINLHLHIHSVVSDGVFTPEGEKGIRFHPAAGPISAQDREAMTEAIRRRVLRRFRRRGVIDEETETSMRSWEHGGFSLNNEVWVTAEDRAGLERLLGYCLRGAIKQERLAYDGTRVTYRLEKGKRRGLTLEWSGEEFVHRWGRLIPPPRQHLVTYGGVLGPRSELRGRVTAAAREERSYEDLLAGRCPSGVEMLVRDVARTAGGRAKMFLRSWAACLRRVFEIDPILCSVCGVEMVPVAAIRDVGELERLLKHLGLPTEWPRTKPARAPPGAGMDSQINPMVERWEGIDSPSPEV